MFIPIPLRAETERCNYVVPGRRGRVVEIGGLAVSVDDENYDKRIIEALERGDYEDIERQLVGQLITHSDRVIDVGTAIGVVAMTAASIVGADGVVTFDGNPDIVDDARANFRRNGLEGIRSHVSILRNRRAITHPHETKTFHIDKAFWASRLNVSVADTNIVKTVQVPILCLEDVIENRRATVLICDMEGAEVELFKGADLSRIRLIIMETHYWVVGELATDEMVRQLIKDGFSLHLGPSGLFRGPSPRRVLVLRRHKIPASPQRPSSQTPNGYRKHRGSPTEQARDKGDRGFAVVNAASMPLPGFTEVSQLMVDELPLGAVTRSSQCRGVFGGVKHMLPRTSIALPPSSIYIAL